MLNRKMLEDRIQQKGLKKSYIAERLGISRATLSSMLNGKTEFRLSHVRTLCKLLDIRDEETLLAIFFNQNGA